MFLKLLVTFLILTSAGCASANEKLIFAIDVIRHGDRTPIIAIPKLAHQWNIGLGQLTAKGIQQEFNLGVSLRRRYVNHYHLLPENYLASTMYVRSDDDDRTLMSAASLLRGLYPTLSKSTATADSKHQLFNEFQPIPVHTESKAHDKLFYPISKENFATLIKNYVASRQDWQAKLGILQPQFAHWSATTGVSVTNFKQLSLLADSLYIARMHQLPLPAGLNQENASTIIKEGHWALLTLYKPYEIGRAQSSAILSSIATYFQQASRQVSTLKYVLFSGHDTTILSLMSAMGVPLNVLPDYASDLNFSLFESSPHQYTVSVMYNNKLIFIPACKGTSCTLQQFLNLASTRTIEKKIIKNKLLLDTAKTLKSSGSLQIAPDQYLYLQVSNEFKTKLFPLLLKDLSIEEKKCITENDNSLGEHISLYYPGELSQQQIQSLPMNNHYTFTPSQLMKVKINKPTNAKFVQEVQYILTVQSAELASLLLKIPPIKSIKPDLPLHITIAVSRYRANGSCFFRGTAKVAKFSSENIL